MFLKPKRQHVIDKKGDLIKRDNSVDKYLKPNKKRYWKFIIIGVVAVIIGLGAWFGVSAWKALAQIITKNSSKSAPFLNFLGDVKPSQLQGEGDGRINILLLGYGGKDHPGGLLTDTIMVASIDPVNKKMALLSIPRDLYVNIPDAGYSKINYAHAYGEEYQKDNGGGPAVSKEVVSQILDLPIHYYISADFSGFTKFIDELGGVDVNVETDLYDPYYPASNMIDYDPFEIFAGAQHLDGENALKYARSRETTSDFDRARRQQQVMVGAKDKALSLGVLTNPVKVTELLQIIGDHVRTDMQTWEMEKLASLLKDVDTSNIVTKVLDNSASGLLDSDVIEGGYYLVPAAGVGNYSQIQKLAHSIFTDPYIQKENAKIEVLNGTGISGKAQEVADTLTGYGYNVIGVDSNSETVEKTTIDDCANNQKPFTFKYLTDRFSAQTNSTCVNNSYGADIIVIVGKDYKSQ